MSAATGALQGVKAWIPLADGGIDLSSTSPAQWIVGALVTIGGSWLLYKQTSKQADTAREASVTTSKVDAQESALQAWQAMMEPLQADVARLRAEAREDRDAREKERVEWERRAAEMRSEMGRLREELRLVRRDLGNWRRMAKAIAKWALTLRDQVIALGGQVPNHPDELLLLQAVTSDDSDSWMLQLTKDGGGSAVTLHDPADGPQHRRDTPAFDAVEDVGP